MRRLRSSSLVSVYQSPCSSFGSTDGLFLQRQPDGILQDSENKAWRPLPLRRLTPKQTALLVLETYFLEFLSSLYLRGVWQCVILSGLGYWYNDLEGADSNCNIQNLINACAYVYFISGALELVSDPPIVLLKPVAYRRRFKLEF